ncbi:MAG: lysophospholipid acyltransferase family protein [Planctomycetota bacterium]
MTELAESRRADAPAPRTRIGVVYGVIWVVSFVLGALFFRRRAAGRELVPDGPVLLVANHASYLDIPLVGSSLRRHVCYVARHTLADNPLLAWTMHRCGSILIRRDTPDRAAIGQMVGHLRAGDCVLIFPEGRRSRTGELLPFKGGAALVARRGGAPVVPVAIFGSGEALPPGRWPRPRPTGVRFGAPLEPGPDVLDRARRALEGLLAAGRP